VQAGKNTRSFSVADKQTDPQCLAWTLNGSTAADPCREDALPSTEAAELSGELVANLPEDWVSRGMTPMLCFGANKVNGQWTKKGGGGVGR